MRLQKRRAKKRLFHDWENLSLFLQHNFIYSVWFFFFHFEKIDINPLATEKKMNRTNAHAQKSQHVNDSKKRRHTQRRFPHSFNSTNSDFCYTAEQFICTLIQIDLYTGNNHISGQLLTYNMNQVHSMNIWTGCDVLHNVPIKFGLSMKGEDQESYGNGISRWNEANSKDGLWIQLRGKYNNTTNYYYALGGST